MAKVKTAGFNRLLIPVKKTNIGKGWFRLSSRAILAGHWTSDILPLQQLSRDLSRLSVVTGLSRGSSEHADVRLYHDGKIKNHEAYRINITGSGIEVYAGTDTGSYYAIQTLRDIFSIFGKTVPACQIEDEPDFRRRGVYHDCSRGKVPTLETLCELVARLAHWKINELQLYIENVFMFRRHPEIGRGFSPFTPEEILKLQNHCKQHHVRLVGSLASFGHMEKILALPHYRHLGEMPGFRNFPGGTTLCPIDPGSIKLVTELYDEYALLFDADDFNVCCDETWELGKGRSKSRTERIGPGRIYLEFLLKIYELCQRHGKRMNLWADIILKYPELMKELPSDVVLLNWEYEHDGVNITRTEEIAEAGRNFMICPGTSSWLSHGSRMSNSMGNVANFAKQGRKYKAEGLLNTDWGDKGHRNFLGASLHGFAHGAAHAWNGKAVDNEMFTENFCFHTFGQKNNKLANNLKLLGSTYMTCGCSVPNKSLLYEALVESFVAPNAKSQSSIDMMTEKGLRKIVSQFSGEKVQPAHSKAMDKFDRLALEELELAGQMDCLAAERALRAKTLRAGEKVNQAGLLQLSRRMQQLAKDFKSLWLERNKPSRLNDNLKLFQNTQRQSSRLIKKI